jgi:hypothetical protein
MHLTKVRKTGSFSPETTEIGRQCPIVVKDKELVNLEFYT